MSITRNLLLTALLASAGHAVAASSVDVSIRGSITPSACTPALSNGGVADFGKIAAKDLRPDLPTYLTGMSLEMSVTCEAATLLAIAAQDNREGTESSLDYYNFGLGLINGSEKLGYAMLYMSGPIADGVNVRAIGSQDNGATWGRESSFMDDGLLSVADATTLAPLPLQRLTAALKISPVIAPAKNLTLTNEAPIDGSVTLTVRYL
ncbi:DUF1120 domain-containing protein [Pseudomonas sp. WS 5106]|uniref:DUF1120 domain-containing protein n=1 Tax=Pseudomonas cremoris TaxID=2724178 RepID=A0A7X1DXS9_9PSED|nr:DUF1120 domain-containing protein [Pseudomonas cremoris]MBC2381893.1 DUF1120 domain-containing protein [Pseudomonas cremoris]MBC2405696.1 DUF1120 domain-containing protein [Pseudomonas cremoris]MBC2406332.1 DUF1120 domain-containing protein [Pseudomonas cremoris]